MRRILLAIPVLLLLQPPVPALGHGAAGNAQQRAGDYTADMAFDAQTLEAGRETEFDFSLILGADKPQWEFVHVDEVRVRAEREGATAFERTLRPEEQPGPAHGIFVFPENGRYDLHVAFLHDGGTLAETTFAIRVGRRAVTWEVALSALVVSLNIGFFCVLFGVWMGRRRARVSTP